MNNQEELFQHDPLVEKFKETEDLADFLYIAKELMVKYDYGSSPDNDKKIWEILTDRGFEISILFDLQTEREVSLDFGLKARTYIDVTLMILLWLTISFPFEEFIVNPEEMEPKAMKLYNEQLAANILVSYALKESKIYSLARIIWAIDHFVPEPSNFLLLLFAHQLLINDRADDSSIVHVEQIINGWVSSFYSKQNEQILWVMIENWLIMKGNRSDFTIDNWIKNLFYSLLENYPEKTKILNQKMQKFVLR